MCELLAVNSADPIKMNRYLKEFFSHSDTNPHGWGIAIFDGPSVSLEKEARPSAESGRLAQILSKDISVKNMAAHIRNATAGSMRRENCHPFLRKDATGRNWTLAHNGTIFHNALISPYTAMQEGNTDSERVLLALIARIDAETGKKKRLLSADERFALTDTLITELSEGNKLNLLLYDGEFLYVHYNLSGTLHMLSKGNGLLFSTQPLSDEDWQPVPFMTLCSFKNGRLIRQGACHGHEYRVSEADLAYIRNARTDPSSVS